MTWSHDLLIAHGRASAALARAEAHLALSAAPSIVTARIQFAEQDALAWLEGDSLHHEQLALDYGSSPRSWRHWPYAFVRVFAHDLGVTRPPSAVRVADWINGRCRQDTPSPAPVDLPLTIADDRLASFCNRVRALASVPRLIAGADIAAAFVWASPLAHGNPVIGVMLAERYALAGSALTSGGIAAIGLKALHTPWHALVRGFDNGEHDDLSASGSALRLRLAWLASLEHGADHAHQLATAVRLWLRRLDEACTASRRTSHLGRLCLLAAESPAINVTRASKTLGISRQATNELITTACRHQLLREITLGSSFRRYHAAIS